MIIHASGDLFQRISMTGVQSIAHGVNTQGVMGAGFAKQIVKRYPLLLNSYQNACQSGVLLPGGCWQWKNDSVYIYNLATQEFYGERGRARIEWVASAIDAMYGQLVADGINQLSMPRIASGLGELNWTDVQSVIEKIMNYWPGVLTIYSLE